MQGEAGAAGNDDGMLIESIAGLKRNLAWHGCVSELAWYGCSAAAFGIGVEEEDELLNGRGQCAAMTDDSAARSSASPRRRRAGIF